MLCVYYTQIVKLYTTHDRVDVGEEGGRGGGGNGWLFMLMEVPHLRMYKICPLHSSSLSLGLHICLLDEFLVITTKSGQ